MSGTQRNVVQAVLDVAMFMFAGARLPESQPETITGIVSAISGRIVTLDTGNDFVVPLPSSDKGDVLKHLKIGQTVTAISVTADGVRTASSIAIS